MPRLRRLTALVFVALLVPAAVRADEPFRYPEGTHGAGSLRYVGTIPVLTVAGTPEEIGTAIGTLTRPAADGLFGYFDTLLKKTKLDLMWPWLERTAEGMLERFPPDHRAELEAAVKASGIDRGKVLVGNCLWDIKKLGCSTLYVAPGRSGTGGPLLGRNFDFPTFGVLNRYSLVIVYRPTGKHAFASVLLPGLIGCVSGMNDAGLCVAVLDVPSAADGSPPFDLSGTPLTLSFRRIMEECTTVDEAEKLLRSVKRTTLLNLAVCDARGGAAVFELTPRSVGVRRPQDGLCACTNHFRTDGLATDTRCERFDALEKSRGLAKLGLPDVQRHLHDARQGEATFQTMIFEPATRTLHLALGMGPTTAKPLQKLELGPMFQAERR
jgi:hypothetical protein